MIRSTTPTIKCILENKEVIEESLGNIYVTLQQGPVVLTKRDVIVDTEEGTVSINLTQKNTLMFKPGMAKIQIKGKTSEGLVWATSSEEIEITEILYKQEI